MNFTKHDVTAMHTELTVTRACTSLFWLGRLLHPTDKIKRTISVCWKNFDRSDVLAGRQHRI